MKVLVACEASQEVCKAFRKLGHDAYSCDIQECYGGHPEWHILGDAVETLNGGIITTMDGKLHVIDKWDLLIAHPPCTYLTVSGNRWFNIEKYGDKAKQRIKDRDAAAKFFMKFINANVEKIAVENPVGYMSTYYRKPDCIIQPYEFGHEAVKKTCLWLKNLPALRPTNIVNHGEILPGGYSLGAHAHYAVNENGKILPWNDPLTAKLRSKTFPGIAKAMAEQWGNDEIVCKDNLRPTVNMKKGVHKMEFLVTTANTVTFNNKELQKATNTVLKLGDTIKKNWFAIAHIVAHVDATECYKDDGFNTVHEWVEKTFGIKKTASYSLLTIGKEYTREIVNASGKVVGYGTNLITDGSDDFSKTQVEKMLPAGHELAVELVAGGEITPEMSAKDISRVVKAHTNPEPDEPETDEPETGDMETETVSVWDKDGNEYAIPIDVLVTYRI